MGIKINGIYKHFKGDSIEVLMLAKHSETLEEMVVYKHLNDDQIWVRPLSMFISKVDKEKYPDVEQEFRFQLVEGM